jgi:hypothetical protein
MTATDKDIERIVHYVTQGTSFEDAPLDAALRPEWDSISSQVATMRSHGVIVAVSNELSDVDDATLDMLYRPWAEGEQEAVVDAVWAADHPDDDDEVTLVSKSVGTHRFTLGPMYIPDRLDAHGEWTDADELQAAVWKYVDSGDRRIRLQHNRDVVAGKWLEVMTWPYPVEVPLMTKSAGARPVTFPANTVFLGVQWEPWAWELIEKGLLRGYSIGGKAERLLVDLPDGEGMAKSVDPEER